MTTNTITVQPGVNNNNNNNNYQISTDVQTRQPKKLTFSSVKKGERAPLLVKKQPASKSVARFCSGENRNNSITPESGCCNCCSYEVKLAATVTVTAVVCGLFGAGLGGTTALAQGVKSAVFPCALFGGAAFSVGTGCTAYKACK